MPATYEPIATTTLGSAASTITFSSIPGTYTDLRVILTALSSTADVNIEMQFNGDTSTNYSNTFIYGDGTNTGSPSYTSSAKIRVNIVSGLSTTIPSLMTIDIFSYTSSIYKTLLSTTSVDKNGSGGTDRGVGLWRDTSAITSILLKTDSGNMAAGTTATLYGILKA